MYYVIKTYISHLQVCFAYRNTYQVFLSHAKAVATLAIVSSELESAKLFLLPFLLVKKTLFHDNSAIR